MKPWRAVVMLSISETVAWGTLHYSFGILLRPFARRLAVSEATIAGAFSVTLLVSAGAASVVGASVDRWGPRPVMTASALVGAVAIASLAVVDTAAGFYVAWAAIGIAHAGALYEPAFAAITSWFPAPAPRDRALLAVTTVAGFASTIFVPLAAAAHDRLGLAPTTLLLAAFTCAVAVPLNAALPRGELAAPPPAADARASAPAAPAPRVAVLAFVFSVQSFASAGVTVHLVALLRERGLDLSTAATLVALMGASQVPARLAFRLLRRLQARSRLPLLLGIQAAALLAVLGRDPRRTALAVLLLGAANGLSTLERAVVTADAVDARDYGAVSARIATPALVGRAAGPFVVGLVQAASSCTTAFAGLAAVTALAAMVQWGCGQRVATRSKTHARSRPIWPTRSS